MIAYHMQQSPQTGGLAAALGVILLAHRGGCFYFVYDRPGGRRGNEVSRDGLPARGKLSRWESVLERGPCTLRFCTGPCFAFPDRPPC